jgi:hypothetical protein
MERSKSKPIYYGRVAILMSYSAAKRKETCSNSVTAGTPLQLQGQQFNVTVEERDNTLVLDAEMPMLNIETLVMAVDDDHSLLTISGEKISPSRKRARIEKTNNVIACILLTFISLTALIRS